MKKINRFKVMFALWAMLLAYCTFISTNVYFNAVIIFVGAMLTILACAHICETMTEKEETFFNKLGTFFN